MFPYMDNKGIDVVSSRRSLAYHRNLNHRVEGDRTWLEVIEREQGEWVPDGSFELDEMISENLRLVKRLDDSSITTTLGMNRIWTCWCLMVQWMNWISRKYTMQPTWTSPEKIESSDSNLTTKGEQSMSSMRSNSHTNKFCRLRPPKSWRAIVLIGFFRTFETIRVKDPVIVLVSISANGTVVIRREIVKSDIDDRDGGKSNKQRKWT